jgi:hypothetical protein
MLPRSDAFFLFALLLAAAASLLFFISVAFSPADAPAGVEAFLWLGLLAGGAVAAVGAAVGRSESAARGR